MQTATEQKQSLSHEEIALLAREFWQKEGCQHGRDLEYWLKAEQQLQGAKNKQDGGVVNSTAKIGAARATRRNSAAR